MTTATLSSPRAESAGLDVLMRIRELGGEVAAVDVGAAEDDGVRVEAVAEVLRTLLERTLALFDELQQVTARTEEDLLFPDLDAVDPDAWFGDTRDALPPRAEDVCFAGALELRRAARELEATSTSDERYAAAETAQRKLRRAIRAVLEAARTSGGPDVLGGEHQGEHHISDLASGLAVRRLYAQFRRALRRAEDASPEAVLVAIRYAGGALATLVTQPDYADVRASDRGILRGLRERALRWARQDRGVATGLQLLDDVWTSGDLLRGINRRQELRAHDAAVIAACRPGPADDLDAWLTRLDALGGLDDVLDERLSQLRAALAAGQDTERYVLEIRHRLTVVRT